MGVRYQKYRSIAIPLNIGIELSQVSRYFDIFGIEPALILYHLNFWGSGINTHLHLFINVNTQTHSLLKIQLDLCGTECGRKHSPEWVADWYDASTSGVIALE